MTAGGSAVAAVEAAIRVLEDDPTFNAGRGAVLNAAGEVECDAAIMDGADLSVGGVAAVRTLRHPISVARRMLPERPDAAGRRGRGSLRPPTRPGILRAWRTHAAVGRSSPGCDTVGCVALDREGDIAAGTSTGGLSGCAVGRVGTSPLPGCGLYADNAVGGVSLSGEGEASSA
ncbi:isoaspartyl peptidase/L-asparaginase [Caulobacter segnis]